ncbi:MAG: GNAT family N-acetyltransferase [Chthoniobacter sp.]|uniref:GNAT family N-acetyltransferase n=1 Tax=Chthoniobacter sp. TaxID=2510640 RepID=UPI0032A19C97
MKLVRWKRFTWQTAKLPPLEQKLPAHFITRAATREEAKAVAHVVITAFSLDSTWSDTLNQFRDRLEMQLDLAFQRETVPAIVITHGPRIIAASVLNTDPDADSNLISGPSVLSEYGNRGLGTALLHASLKQLGEAGLVQAAGITKENSTACKFVYPKFGSEGKACEYAPALAET